MRRINRLSDSVVSRLRSATIFSDIGQIAEELVCNSIDAGATQIQIDVDVEACFLKVDDDGCGISRNDLTIVGERHATSKLRDLEELNNGVKTLGFRGESLSSLSDIALVEITSRCRGTPNTYRKILKDCASVSIGLCGQQRSHGTAVVVKDLFYNQPVRRRLMSTSNRKILLSVKERIVRFILMHPSISFKVTDLARLEVPIHSKSATSSSTALCDMFGKDLLLSLEEVDFSQGPLRIAGYLSRRYHCISSKTVQFFYINRRFVRKTPVHRVLNKWAQSSKKGPRTKVVTSTQLTCGGRGADKQDGYSEKHLLPAFVLNLSCPLSEYDITFEASKTEVEFKDWLPVVGFVRSVLQSMWGNLSDVPEGGLIHASRRSTDLSVKIGSRKNIKRQEPSAVPFTGSKNIPPMSVRRALVQGGSVDPCSPVIGSVERSVGKASHSLSHSRSKPRDSASPAHGGYDGLVEGMSRYTSERFTNSPGTIGKTLAEISSHVIPGRRWTMVSCGQGETLPKSVPVAGTVDLSVPCIEVELSPSTSDSFTNLRLELSPDSASVMSRCTFERFRSSCDYSSIAISPPLAETCTVSSLVEGVMEHPGDLHFNSRLSRSKKAESCAFLKDVQHKNSGASFEVPDLNMGAMLWSENGDSYSSMSSPDSSCFLSEDRTRPPNVSRMQETFAWMVTGSDMSPYDAVDKRRESGKLSTVTEMSGRDNVFTDHLICNGERSRFNDFCKDFDLLEHSERHSCKVHVEAFAAQKVCYLGDAQELQQPWAECSVGKFPSNSGGKYGPSDTSYQHDSGRSCHATRPGVKRKLETFFLDHIKNSSSRPDYRDDLEARMQDSDQSSSVSRSKLQRRSHSAPPFPKPPNRSGLHENPPSSLFTNKMGSVDTFGDSTHSRTKRGRAGAPTAPSDKSTGQELQHTRCLMDQSLHTSFSPPFPRKGPELDADDSVEISCTEEDYSGQLTRQLDSSSVTPLQLELLEGQNHAVPSGDAIKNMLKDWSNPCMKNDEGVLDLSSGILCWKSISFLPDTVAKESLQHARVLQQVDKKFIPAVADGVLLIIDQHAADERVRLEELRDRVLGSGPMKQAAPLSRTQEVTMAFTEQQMLQTYREQIEDWGWRFRLPCSQSLKTKRAGSSVVGVSSVLLSAVPCILGVMLTGDDLTEYLRQLMDTEGSSSPPPAVIRVLNYKACRGAIMFGDTLLPAESRQLVEHLKQTSLCFQCAHGRPTMVPVVDLRALRKRLLSSDSICGNVRDVELARRSTTLKSDLVLKEWHRLPRKNSSFDRSLERLKQAQQA